MGGYNHRSVIFAKQLLIAWQIYRNTPYVEISPVDVGRKPSGRQAERAHDSATLATVT